MPGGLHGGDPEPLCTLTLSFALSPYPGNGHNVGVWTPSPVGLKLPTPLLSLGLRSVLGLPCPPSASALGPPSRCASVSLTTLTSTAQESSSPPGTVSEGLLAASLRVCPTARPTHRRPR